MREIHGTSDLFLDVDLTSRKVEVCPIAPRERRLYLGGKGLGLKLLYDRLDLGCDPLAPENIIAFMPGALMGTNAPCSARFQALALSPLTGFIATSSCGGPFGLALKTAGWDGLLIRGRAESPTWLLVSDQGVEFNDAASLWGRDIPDAQEALAGPRRGVVVIGPAGENLVPMAGVASGSRFLGRCGLGAVLGSKNLKAVAAQGGTVRIMPKEPKALARLTARAKTYIDRQPLTGRSYRDFGTNANVRLNQAGNILPVDNFASGQHPDFDLVSGQTLAQRHQTSHHGCKPCSIRCGHRGTFADGVHPVPEYETVGLLGTNLGIFDSEAIARFNNLCGRLGLDTMSAGGTIAWAMEATAKGLFASDLAFGSIQGVEQALTDMAHRRGQGAELALGSRRLSEKYGGRDFAMQVKGLEMAAYDPRGSFGHGLAYAVANRGGCHLSSYLVAQEVFLKLLDPASTRGKARWVKFFEDLTACINSVQTCQFTMFAYLLEPPLTRFTPDLLLAPLMQHLPLVAIPLVDFSLYQGLFNAVTGLGLTRGEFLMAGERAHVLERHLNCRLGMDRHDDILPGRLLKEGRASDPKAAVVPLAAMLGQYYKLRGYDEDGRPRPETLERLAII